MRGAFGRSSRRISAKTSDLSLLRRRLIVAPLAGRNLLPGSLRAEPVAHLGLHALEFFIGAEESGDLALPVGGQIIEVMNIGKVRIISCHGEDLLVLALLVRR